MQDLHVTFPTVDGLVQAVRGISLRIDAGRTLAVVVITAKAPWLNPRL